MLRYRPAYQRASRAQLAAIYRRLWQAFGPQRWWPAKSSFEVMVGAILTQATKWHNVEEAIVRLRRARALTPNGLAALPRDGLEMAVRPAGYFRQKARYVSAFARWYVKRFRGRADVMFRTPWPMLRRELLSQHGIGPETADSILLYAGCQPVFVVDAYTRRVLRRHRLISSTATYGGIQTLVMQTFPGRTAWYNEFHALLVAVGKRYCHRRHPACQRCPLGALPHTRIVV